MCPHVVHVTYMYLPPSTPPPPLPPSSPHLLHLYMLIQTLNSAPGSNQATIVSVLNCTAPRPLPHMYIYTYVIESKWVKSLHFITWVPLSPVIRSKSVETLGTSPPSTAVSRYAVREGRGRRGSRYFAFCSQ